MLTWQGESEPVETNENAGQVEESERGDVPVVRSRGLLAEYAIGKRTAGDWFAVGTVREEGGAYRQPAWIIVGTGPSEEGAVDDLRDRLDEEALRLSVA